MLAYEIGSTKALSQSVFLEALTSPNAPQNKYSSSKYSLETYSVYTHMITFLKTPVKKNIIFLNYVSQAKLIIERSTHSSSKTGDKITVSLNTLCYFKM